MKTILLTCLLCVSLFFHGTAQWANNGTGIYNTNTGNVRIENTSGLSINGTGVLQVDAPNIVGGRFSVGSNGFVGIGAPSPSTLLHIRSGASPTIRVGHFNAAEGYVGEIGSISFFKHWDLNFAAKIYSFTNWATDEYQGADLRFATSNKNTSSEGLTDRMRILPNGNVGIGTLNPDFKLTVNGKIKAEEIQVVVDVPADYVFEKDYSLMPLTGVEKYINENKHLPNVPSAAEIKEKGYDVGQMSNKLLEKIEELTLYVIELKRENEELRKRLEKVERKK